MLINGKRLDCTLSADVPALQEPVITWICESCESSFQRDKAEDPAAEFCPFCGADEGAAWDLNKVTLLLGGGFVVKG